MTDNWVPSSRTASLRSRPFSSDRSKRRRLKELSLGIASRKISRACYSAFCSAFEFLPARNPNGPYSKASRALRLPFWIEFATRNRQQ